MSKLNLATKNAEQEKIKQYLEENASDVLIKKINEGVEIVKDNKLVINKKDLDGFWSYAIEEAKKQADKNARGAIVDDQTVFGWAIHYFEESSIEGKLYNLDGTEYKPEIKQVEKTKVEVKKEPEKPKNTQGSFFDFTDIEEPKQEEFKPIQEEIIEYEEPDELFDDTTEKVPVKRINQNTVIDLKTGEVIVENADYNEDYINKLKTVLGAILEVKLWLKKNTLNQCQNI